VRGISFVKPAGTPLAHLEQKRLLTYIVAEDFAHRARLTAIDVPTFKPNLQKPPAMLPFRKST
jgi:hypothetical protein